MVTLKLKGDKKLNKDMLGKLKEKDYFIAYIDILGIKDSIASEQSELILNRISTMYYMAEEMANNKAISGLSKLRFCSFSDNFVLAVPIGDNETENLNRFNYLVTIVSLFQLQFLNDFGLLFRGGITADKLYIDGSIVWGQALVRAYELESEVAKYPRVVLDTNIPVIEKYYQKSTHPYEKVFYDIDTDGLTFVKYLDKEIFKAAKEIDEINKFELERIENFIDDNINSHNDNKNILEKWTWVKEKFEALNS